ncbi:MAG: hypothetical protein AAF383_02055 [Cyanobacteria bacterium P01_A01_bin.83]
MGINIEPILLGHQSIDKVNVFLGFPIIGQHLYLICLLAATNSGAVLMEILKRKEK